jgi:hypothetical protein
MALMKGKASGLTIDGDVITNANNTQLEFTMDTEDVTVYGQNSHRFSGLLAGGTATISGFADDTAATGNRAVLRPLVASGAVVEMVWQPKGTGASFPQDTVDVIVTKYTETSAVAEHIKFAIDVQFSGDVDATPQSA